MPGKGADLLFQGQGCKLDRIAGVDADAARPGAKAVPHQRGVARNHADTVVRHVEEFRAHLCKRRFVALALRA